MICRPWIIASALLLPLQGGCKAKEAAQARSFRTITFGLCVNFDGAGQASGHDAAEAIREKFSLIRSLNVRHVRIGFAWDRIEPADDAFDWTHTDRLVRIAADEFDLTLLPYVHRPPGWVISGGTGGVRGDEFAEFMRALVERYREEVRSWELWSRPDAPEGWVGGPAQFAALVREGAQATRSIDPEAHIVLGSMAADLNFLRGVLMDGSVEPYAEAVGLEVSTSHEPGDAGEDAHARVLQAADIVRMAGDAKPIWLTATCDAAADAESQAFDLLRVFTQALATGEVHLAAWDPEVAGGGPSAEITPTLAGFALARHVFAGAVRGIDHQLRISAPPGGDAAGAHAHAFERWDKSVVIIAWIDPNASPESAAPPRRIGLWLPIEKLEAAAVFDHLGRPLDPPELSHAGKWTVIRSLEVRSGEVMIIELRPRR